MALVPARTTTSTDPWDPIEYRPRYWRDWDEFDLALKEARALSDYPLYRSNSLAWLNLHHGLITKDGFRVSLDVHKFKPSEITVKIESDTIVIEGKHEDRWAYDKLTRRDFCNKYTLPLGYDPWQVTSTLTADGILTVKCPPPRRTAIQCYKRYVPITHI
ncbi:heat shock protein 27-like [Condylostylus longicornis]|uniref:heat shock protein 27-like n=1 Tax=Condylostylus longicornis TaxID=2530218 RepID=UPI00244E32B6|nr:heat shock protein 27-like [Condylostylus longicornis]